MAQVQTLFTITDLTDFMRFRSFTQDPRFSWPDIPLREAWCNIDAGDIPLTGVGDNQQLVINIDLPSGRAYRMVETFFRINSVAGSANNWKPSMGALYRNEASGAASTQGKSITVPIEMFSRSAQVTGGNINARFYSSVDLPSLLWTPATPDDNVSLHIEGYNTQANDAAYTLRFFCRFYEYEVGRASNWGTNRAIPTYT